MTILLAGGLQLPARPDQDAVGIEEQEIKAAHSECAFFVPEKREHILDGGLSRQARPRYTFGDRTVQIANQLRGNKGTDGVSVAALAEAGPRTANANLIDEHLFKAMQDAGIAPAPRTNDYEFIRRVTYDLTGRPARYDRVMQFVQNADPNKRAALVDELLASREWVDKWTMYFGDLYANVNDNGQVRRHMEGANIFQRWIKDSLASNKSYDKWVTELLTASTQNSWEDGASNWILGGLMNGGPIQDNFDMMSENVAEMFLGMGHQNCLVCHNGRGHLDDLSVWGKSATRAQAQGLASFFSKVQTPRVLTNPELRGASPYYFRVIENARAADYPLNGAGGNRTARTPIGSTRNIAPDYPFFAEGAKPASGENYRAALARIIVSDPQFARATVNYIWAQFFGRGIVEPANLFDPGRMDPNNPPPAPWTIQPTNPALLEALAKDFQTNGFNLKDLMRKMATSNAYQLSSAYNGEWRPNYETYFARHLVRRLWAEEVTDSMIQISNLPFSFSYAVSTLRDPAKPDALVPYAMQLTQTRNLPANNVNMRQFLDAFLRGNRVDAPRKGEGSIPQALNLMNDSFVMDRTRARTVNNQPTLAQQLLAKYSTSENAALVNELFVTILNRPPTSDESITANGTLNTATNNAMRQQRLEDLIWALFNKVDFIYNY
jgi:hypothetical protein